MSLEHRDRIRTELEMLSRLFQDHAPLLNTLCGDGARAPSPWERSACAALLHAFYNGVENVFKNVARARGEAIERTGDWHAALLDRMSRGTAPVIDAPLADQLKEYLRFRHFFRNAYTFDIRWEKLRPLLENLESVASMFQSQVQQGID